jgi:CheY-like chemotaxis protein
MTTLELPVSPSARLSPRRRPTVLLVEDEILLSDVVAEELEAAGYQVLTALTGEEALMLLEAQDSVDLLLTDVRLPGGVDGWQVAAAARRTFPALPVIYAVGYPVDQPRKASGSRFVSKPYCSAAVFEAIETLGVTLRA